MKKVAFVIVTILLWLILIYTLFSDSITEYIYLFQNRAVVFANKKIQLNSIKLSGDDHLIYSNCTLSINSSIELVDNAKLELYNCTLNIEANYDNLFKMNVLGNSAFNCIGTTIVSAEESKHYCRVDQQGSVIVKKSQNESLHFYLNGRSEIYIQQSLASLYISSSSHSQILIDDSPYVMLTFEVQSPNMFVKIPGGEYVAELDIHFIADFKIEKSYVNSINFVLYPLGNITIEQCQSVGIIWIYDGEQDLRLDQLKRKSYRDSTFSLVQSSLTVKNSKLDDIILVNKGRGELYLNDCDISVISVSNDAVVIGQGIRTDFVETADESVVILYDSIVVDGVDIGNNSNLFVENCEIPEYNYTDRSSKFYFYTDGARSTQN